MKLLSTKNNRKARLAFTLVDVMVAMGVLGVVLLSLFASFTFGFSQIKLFREELRATQILQEKTEALRLYTWLQINSQFVPENFTNALGSTPNFFRGKLKVNPVVITNTSYSTNLRQIEITVNWTNNHKIRTRSTRTFVSEFGLQNYVFSYQ